DQALAALWEISPEAVRTLRLQEGIVPSVKQIDTLAGEFAAQTNYLYLTYNGCENDIDPSEERPIFVLGSGPYCIGSSVEFDWCAVNALKSLRRIGLSSVMINSNPETVSTDYDESGRLYFEELTLERVRDIADFENPRGIIISVGGQIANNLASPLAEAGYPLLGTPASSIDSAENRKEFSSLLGKIGVDQPLWEEAQTLDQAKRFAKRVGYPLLVRPSYVLSGAAMNVVFNDEELKKYLTEAARISRGHPVVISQFIENAKELEIDGVAKEGKIVIEAITEHVENAGVHSGDATVVLPPQRLYLETIRRAKQISRKIAHALKITGPFNIQFLAKENALKVIECNVRASRSFPFVSKVTNHNFIDTAVRAMLGDELPEWYETLELDHVGVKTPQFSYSRLKGANPVAQVEMASTGEVACLGANLHEAFMQSWLATGQKIRGKRLLVSIGGDKKGRFLDVLRKLERAGWELFATDNTHDFLVRSGVASHFLYKASESLEPNIKSAISGQEVDLIVNIPNNRMPKILTDGFTIRRLAIDHNIPLITNMQIALLFLHCLTTVDLANIPVKSWKSMIAGEVYAS
ncbi:MAG: ATP-grasp domain-containing protein, partial [Chlamydiia bacterium]|nr:ATP-grasp domain-containing protein [Chlamydiia bacterium]